MCEKKPGGGAGQYRGTLHNSLSALIYYSADLDPSQFRRAFVIFEPDPTWRKKEKLETVRR